MILSERWFTMSGLLYNCLYCQGKSIILNLIDAKDLSYRV